MNKKMELLGQFKILQQIWNSPLPPQLISAQEGIQFDVWLNKEMIKIAEKIFNEEKQKEWIGKNKWNNELKKLY